MTFDLDQDLSECVSVPPDSLIVNQLALQATCNIVAQNKNVDIQVVMKSIQENALKVYLSMSQKAKIEFLNAFFDISESK